MAYRLESLAIHTAEKILKMVLDKDNDNINAMQDLAIIMQMTDRCQQAIKLSQRILAKDPENLIVMNNLAWILCEDLKQYQQALDIVEKGLNMLPNYTDMIDTRGVIFYRMGRFNQSVKDFKLCIEMYPSGTPALASSYFHLGKALAELKENSKALRNLRTSLDMANRTGGLSPQNLTEARNLIKKLSLKI